VTSPNTTITEVQLMLLRDYLDDDCQMHLSAPHRCWRLDSGKLMAALEYAGIGVEFADGDETWTYGR
jgi:hypothetical protein